MTSKDDVRLYGRHPEFARMSLKPGIGADFMHEVASSHMEFNLASREVDVPSTLRHGGRMLPLGPYLTRKLRTYVGMDPRNPLSINPPTPETYMYAMSIRDNSTKEEKEQKISNMVKRREIFNRKRKL